MKRPVWQREMTVEEWESQTKRWVRRAEKMYAECGLSPTLGVEDMFDTVTDMLLCTSPKKKSWRRATSEVHRMRLIYQRIRDGLKNKRKSRLTCCEQVMTKAISVDEAPHGVYTEDGDEVGIESTLMSDEGVQAERIRDCETPEYVKLTRKKRAEIMNNNQPKHNNRRWVLRALEKSNSKSDARTIAKVKRGVFWGILNFFKKHFAQCFRAFAEYRQKIEYAKSEKKLEYK